MTVFLVKGLLSLYYTGFEDIFFNIQYSNNDNVLWGRFGNKKEIMFSDWFFITYF